MLGYNPFRHLAVWFALATCCECGRFDESERKCLYPSEPCFPMTGLRGHTQNKERSSRIAVSVSDVTSRPIKELSTGKQSLFIVRTVANTVRASFCPAVGNTGIFSVCYQLPLLFFLARGSWGCDIILGVPSC